MRLEKLLRFPRFSARYDPWRRGKRISLCLGTLSSRKNDFHITRVLMRSKNFKKIIVVSPFLDPPQKKETPPADRPDPFGGGWGGARGRSADRASGQ